MKRCLRCGSKALPGQPLCFDCLMKVYPKLKPEATAEDLGTPHELILVEDDGDVKVYEQADKVLGRR